MRRPRQILDIDSDRCRPSRHCRETVLESKHVNPGHSRPVVSTVSVFRGVIGFGELRLRIRSNRKCGENCIGRRHQLCRTNREDLSRIAAKSHTCTSQNSASVLVTFWSEVKVLRPSRAHGQDTELTGNGVH